MREILFRGLIRRKGEKVRLDGTPVESKWIYGGYCQYNEERGIIYQTEPEIAKFPVYAETVGQYTGLTDKNGRKIFEGDIVVDTWNECKWIATFYDGGFLGENVGDYASEELGELCDLNEKGFGGVIVIGNIHDNPELLKGEFYEEDTDVIQESV